MRRILLPLALSTVGLGAADQVNAVPAADRVVVDFHGVPVGFQLALIAPPEDPSLASQAVARIQEAAVKKDAQVIYKPEYGADTTGTGRVFLRIGSLVLNELLVSEGLARFLPGTANADSPQAKLLKMGEERARERKLGLWGRVAPPPETTVVAVVKPPPTTVMATVAKPAPARDLPFAAELNGKYYHARGDQALAAINPDRLIWYASEAEAKKAGKQAPAKVAVPTGTSLADADLAFGKGKELYAKAVNMPVTPERDQVYSESFQYLTKAVQVYSDAAEAKPDDSVLTAKLEEASRLRYGAMKQRRCM